MQNFKLDNFSDLEITLKEQEQTSGGLMISPWLWESAVGTFLYNCVSDWKENLAAFNQGRADAN